MGTRGHARHNTAHNVGTKTNDCNSKRNERDTEHERCRLEANGNEIYRRYTIGPSEYGASEWNKIKTA